MLLYIQIPYDCVTEERKIVYCTYRSHYDCVTEERKIVYCTYRSPMTVLQRKER